ncbi:MAG TPA: hypothetical protein VIQ31_14830, partial [Phormidium sp.]
MGFYDGPTHSRFAEHSDISKVSNNLKKTIGKFFRQQFQVFQVDETKSVIDSLQMGQAFIIFGYHYNSKIRHIVACALFSADTNGIYINWIAVSRETMDKSKFGITGNKQHFHACGLGKLLLILIQTRSAVKGWNTSIYLQVNQASDATKFYESLGFQKMSRNAVTELPAPWQTELTKPKPDFYIKFVDDEQNSRGSDPANYLHLYHLPSTLLKSMIAEVAIANRNDILLPEEKLDAMFVFPFDVMGYKADKIAEHLHIFGHPAFCFKDKITMINRIESKNVSEGPSRPYQKALISKQHYLDTKKYGNGHDNWLTSEDMGLTLQWFLRDYDSPITTSIEIIRSDFLKTLELLYDTMMGKPKNIRDIYRAFSVHSFLSQNIQLLEKRFIFFIKNVRADHWVTTCLCNPWYFMAKEMKRSGSALTDVIENMDEFVHGWLMFDPLHGFLPSMNLKDSMKKERDMFIWLMNMAALYTDCSFERTLFNFDFQMHLFLRHDTMQNWITRFNHSEKFYKAAEKTLAEIKAKTELETAKFQAVAKWFIHGLSGPFGVVSGVRTLNSARLGYPHVPYEDLSHPMNITPPPSSFAFVQKDSHNCGVCCLLFIMDFLVTQATKSWKISVDPSESHLVCSDLGAALLLPSIRDHQLSDRAELQIQGQLKVLYTLFCEELVIMMERLRLLYLECQGSQFTDEEKQEWGKLTLAWKALHQLSHEIIPRRPKIDIAQFHAKVQELQDNVLRLQVFDPLNYNVIQKTDNFTSFSPKIIDDILGSDFQVTNNLDQVIVAVYGLEDLQKKFNAPQTSPGSPNVVQIHSIDTEDTNLPMAEPLPDDTKADTEHEAGEEISQVDKEATENQTGDRAAGVQDETQKKKADEVIDVDKPPNVDQDAGTDKVQYLYTVGDHPEISSKDALEVRVKPDDLPDVEPPNDSCEVQDDVESPVVDNNDEENEDKSVTNKDGGVIVSQDILTGFTDDVPLRTIVDAIQQNLASQGGSQSFEGVGDIPSEMINEEEEDKEGEEDNEDDQKIGPSSQNPPPADSQSKSSEDQDVEYDNFNIQDTKDNVARAHQRPAAATMQGKQSKRTKHHVRHHAKRMKTRVQEQKEYEKKKPKPRQQLATRLPRNAAPVASSQHGSCDLLGFTINTDSYKGKPWLQDVLSLNNQDFEPTQTSFQAAMEEFKQLLDVLDQDDLEELQDALSSDGEKERLEEAEAEKLKEAKFLATVHNVHKVTAIAWIPQIIPNTQVVNPRHYPDCSLKGHWVIKYL